jgi:hypothetical protein
MFRFQVVSERIKGMPVKNIYENNFLPLIYVAVKTSFGFNWPNVFILKKTPFSLSVVGKKG